MDENCWVNRSFVVYDLETTGIDPFNDRIVTACAGIIPDVEHGPGRRPIPFEWLADPGIEIPPEATRVHGISTEYARTHGDPEAQVTEQLASMLEAMLGQQIPIVGMNVPFDFDFLEQACLRHGLMPLSARGRGVFPAVDVSVLDLHVDPYRKGSRNLTALCQHYGVALEGAHDSTADAVAAGKVAWHIMNRYPELAAMKVGDLHAAQVEWKAQQVASRNEYWARTGALDRDGGPRRASPHWPHAPLGVGAR